MGQPRWSISGLMRGVALTALALGVVRAGYGHILAIALGGFLAALVAPWLAYHAVQRLDRRLLDAGKGVPRTDRHILLLAAWGVFVWGAWTALGWLVAVVGALVSLGLTDRPS